MTYTFKDRAEFEEAVMDVVRERLRVTVRVWTHSDQVEVEVSLKDTDKLDEFSVDNDSDRVVIHYSDVRGTPD